MPPEHEYIDAKEAEAESARGLSERVDSKQASQDDARSKSAQEAAQPLYDSADRRQATAANLEGKGIDAETVATRMRADVSQGRPASEAVAGAASKRAPKARANRSRSAQAQRGDVSRVIHAVRKGTGELSPDRTGGPEQIATWMRTP